MSKHSRPRNSAIKSIATKDARRIRVFWFSIWFVAVLLLAEGMVRAIGVAIGRDQGVALPRPGTRVVCCLGDSFTYGQGVTRDQTKATRVTRNHTN
jgi:hypothetical protein